MPKDNGGPAFPCDVFDPDVQGPEQWEGMSLRDYFAGKALQGLLAYPGDVVDDGRSIEDIHAQASYRYADAMLEARKS